MQNEIEISNLCDKEFKVNTIKVLTEHRKRMDNLSANFKKEKKIFKELLRTEEKTEM